MKSRLLSIAKVFIFWTLYFLFARLFFLFYNWKLTQEFSVLDILQTFTNGIKMDLSMAGYFTIVISFLFTVTFWTNSKIISKSIEWLNKTLIIASSFLLIIDSEIYGHWSKHIDNTILLYLQTPEEAFASLPIMSYLMLIAVAGILSAIWFFIYNKFVKPQTLRIKKTKIICSLYLAIITVLIVIPIRGGLGIAPINTGSVFFHKDIYPNNLAVNYCWTTLKSLTKTKINSYNYKFMDQQEAKEIVNNFRIGSDTTLYISKIEKPNFILIILESFTAKAIAPLGGLPNITPNLNKIAKEGIYFSNFYSSGARSDKGLVSILSGFPAQPSASIMKYSQKTTKLPGLPKELSKAGYTTEFTYGGNVDFANMHSYLINIGFDRLITKNDYPSSEDISKWGIPDKIMFNRFVYEVDNTQFPFFKTLYTLSSHEPFDFPTEKDISNMSKTEKFLLSIQYTDQGLGEFIRKSKMKPWWDSTIIVITADHGHPLPNNSQINEKKRYHIPLIFTGGAIDTSFVSEKISNHTDISRTLLNQAKLNSDKFKYSKDLFDEQSKSFSFFVYSKAIGYIDNNQTVTYQRESNQFTELSDKTITEETKTKILAYMQTIWNDFINY